MFGLFKKKGQDKKSDFEIEEDDQEQDSEFLKSLRINLSRLIAYADSADATLQREVAEKLANEAVNPNRQIQIVEYGGLKLLVPLTKSKDPDVQRLSAHALANLSVNADNQTLMAKEGAIEMLIDLLDSSLELTQRQAAKALANLGVNPDNKRQIAQAGAIPKLVTLAGSVNIPVRIEAIAALANLAVNDSNEIEIVRAGGLVPIVAGVEIGSNRLPSAYTKSIDSKQEKEISNIEELSAQCSRALRNLSVNPNNKQLIIRLDAVKYLKVLENIHVERIKQQAKRALKNLEEETRK